MSTTTEVDKPEDSTKGVGKCAVTCPMCGLEHTQYRLNPRMFWHTELDMDRKPSKYQCLKAIDGYYPPLYELWHCSRCHFTSHNRTFPAPLKHVFIEKTVVQRHLAEAARGDSAFARVCKALGAGVGVDNLDFPQAVRLALLAVYFEGVLIGLLRQGKASLARSYLRLAWLLRDWKSMSSDFEKEFAAFSELLGKVAADWPEICKTEEDALQHACTQYVDSLSEASVAGDLRETTAILQHLGRICIQIGDAGSAKEHFARCVQVSFDEQNRLVRLLREDEHTRCLSEDDRSRMVTDSRRYKATVDDCQDLLDVLKKSAVPNRSRPAPVPVPVPAPASAPAPAEKKKGLLRGLFGS
ncbi:MAG TPA: hypothetical protein DCS43_06015 [Verrucomicrobia bacterium]|nr:hypothetical protein [Verrucomicrobiota bacterium]